MAAPRTKSAAVLFVALLHSGNMQNNLGGVLDTGRDVT
jgi:hypothetical protein